MSDWVKILCVALIVAFAAAATVQIAQATAMDIQMSQSVDMGGGCPDCPGGGDDIGGICSAGCIVPLVALPAMELIEQRVATVSAIPERADHLTDWRTPPEPFPPKLVS